MGGGANLDPTAAAALAAAGGLDARRVAASGLAAAATALAVAPLIACFDEAITRSASSSAASSNLWAVLAQRLRAVAAHPVNFLTSPAFAWVWFVYAATYCAANLVRPMQIGFAATVLVTLVNTTCGIAKDAAYAKMFQQQQQQAAATTTTKSNNRRPKNRNAAMATTSSPSSSSLTNKSPTPLSALLVWFARDLVSFTFVLTLPEIISKKFKLDARITKFATPVVAQYFTTPLHLLGLSLVNNRNNRSGSKTISLAQHWKAAFGKSYWSTVAARQLRIVPPYSVGGLLNGWILDNLLASSDKAAGAAASAPTP